MKAIFTLLLAGLAVLQPLQGQFESDVINTSDGDLEIFFIGHGTLMFQFNDQVIHIDPVMREADYGNLPDADLILVTHQHGDHLDMNAIRHLLKSGTRVVMTETCLEQLEEFQAKVMKNGDVATLEGIEIHAIPAYNMVHKRPNGQAFHPKGEGNGYILKFGDIHVLIGGDTENIPEYKELEVPVDVAFLPMNLPYTMTPAMVADAARVLHPHILYPYHFGNTDTQELVDLLREEKDIEVRIRDLE
jgi:L-ascorbate metabolism protein UlaG (beta-lactamase superfamily)